MEEKLMRRPQVTENTGMKTSTIYAKMKKLRFPKQYKYGGTACWKYTEIMEYIISGEEYVHQKLLKEKEKIELSK